MKIGRCFARLSTLLLATAALSVVTAGPVYAKTSGPCHFGGVAALGDVAVGVPGESVNGLSGVGGVDVFIDAATVGGTHLFLTAPTNLMANAHIGFSVACGDFNNDGFDDIAAGAPDHDGGYGAVYVFMNNGAGAFPVVLELNPTVLGISDHNRSELGFALAAADFNGDGFDDLAIGIPDYGPPEYRPHRGAIVVVKGPTLGMDGKRLLSATSESDSGVLSYGAVLAAGDIDADGLADLVIGAPPSNVDGRDGFHFHLGYARWMYGHPTMMLDFTQKRVVPWPAALGGHSDDYDYFGLALVMGDFNGDGRDDLAIAAPFSDNGKGEVFILFADRGGRLGITGSIRFTPFSNPDEKDTDGFGWALAAGDYDDDGDDDLAIAAKAHSKTCAAGEVEIRSIEGAVTKLSGPEGCDLHFGYALATTDFNGDGVDDLIAGVPGATISGIPRAGAAHLFPGEAPAGLSGSVPVLVHQAIPGPLYNETPELSAASWNLYKDYSGTVCGEEGAICTPPGERLGSAIGS